jgi:hypothetical protein
VSGGWALTSSNGDAAAALPEHAAPNVSSNVEDDDFWGGGPEAQAKAFADARAAALAAAKTVF